MSAITNDSSRQLTHAGHAVAGATTNALAMFMLQPFFVLKTLAQHNERKLPPLHRLGKGVVFNMASGAPLEAIGFAVENAARTYFPGPKTDTEKFGISLFAGFLGAPTTTIIERPMLVCHTTGFTTMNGIRRVYAKEGWKGFFRGNIATMGREIGYHIGLFACADITAKHLRSFISDESTCERTASVISGCLVGALTNPFDRVKALMQGNVEGRYTSFTGTVRHILATEGSAGLTRGIGWRTASIAGAVLIIREAKSQFTQMAPDSLTEPKSL